MRKMLHFLPPLTMFNKIFIKTAQSNQILANAQIYYIHSNFNFSIMAEKIDGDNILWIAHNVYALMLKVFMKQYVSKFLAFNII